MPISFRKVSYEYSPDTPFAYPALKGIDLELAMGKMTAIIGATGSGKTTLVQHLNALLLPTGGELEVLDRRIKAGAKPKNLKELRRRVGLVFQFPEYQLFEETVLKDVAFGPKNFGLSEPEALSRAKEALALVGIPEAFFERSPLDLSGGQKRRVAIAGIVAMRPEVLVLDEPTAGLDPAGTATMMSLFAKINKEQGRTVLLVTHDMEQVLRYCDEAVVIADGRVLLQAPVGEFFANEDLLSQAQIDPPAIIRFQRALRTGGLGLRKTYLDPDELAKALAGRLRQ